MNRRRTAAACLAGSPLLVTTSHFLWPAHSEGTHAQQLAAAGAHTGVWAAATVVETLGWVLLVPALVVIWQSVNGRGQRLTAIGVWLAVAGMFGYYGSGVMNLVTIVMGRQRDSARMLSLVDSFKHDSGLFLLVVAPLLLGTLALIAVFAGLARAGLVGWWAPAAVFTAIVATQVLSESDNAVLLALALSPLTVTCLVVAQRLAGLGGTSLASPAYAAA